MKLPLKRSHLGADNSQSKVSWRRGFFSVDLKESFFKKFQYPRYTKAFPVVFTQPLANDILPRAICEYYFISMSSLHLTAAFHGYLPHPSDYVHFFPFPFFFSYSACNSFRCTQFAASVRDIRMLHPEEHPTGTRTYVQKLLSMNFYCHRHQQRALAVRVKGVPLAS